VRVGGSSAGVALACTFLIVVDVMLACIIQASLFRLKRSYFLVSTLVIPCAWIIAPVIGSASERACTVLLPTAVDSTCAKRARRAGICAVVAASPWLHRVFAIANAYSLLASLLTLLLASTLRGADRVLTVVLPLLWLLCKIVTLPVVNLRVRRRHAVCTRTRVVREKTLRGSRVCGRWCACASAVSTTGGAH
jgi:hypothetical protein